MPVMRPSSTDAHPERAWRPWERAFPLRLPRPAARLFLRRRCRSAAETLMQVTLEAQPGSGTADPHWQAAAAIAAAAVVEDGRSVLLPHVEDFEDGVVAMLLGEEPARAVQAFLGSQQLVLVGAAVRHEYAGRLVVLGTRGRR